MAKRLPCSAAVSTFGAILATALLASCGSVSPAYADFANKCQLPRPGIDTQGTLADEKNWLRAWTDDLYLWYSEVPNVNPANYATAIDYFNVLKTTAPSPSGNPKDKFHFTMSTAEWNAFSNSGVSVGYGIEWSVVQASPPSRDVRVGYVGASSPGAAANMVRGTQIIATDGVPVADGNRDAINAALGPSAVGEQHTFSVVRPGQTTSPVDVTLTAQNVQSNPVPISQLLTGTTVGYILFNDHIATSENLLIQAISNLKSLGATDLVLDIRYNGGGYLAIASELAYMISGPSTAGKSFEKLTFNDKHPTNDPITGASLTPTPFYTTAVLGSPSTVLPTLGLSRVFVLTGHGTCSASESIINGLRGQNINVALIGLHTCGKPYGFYPADNCGTTFFSIQFKGVNAKGFGDYTDGFNPGGTDAAGVPGCLVEEGFDRELGDPAEKRTAAALQYLANGPTSCPPPPPPGITALSVAASRSGNDAVMAKTPWRDNRILLRNR